MGTTLPKFGLIIDPAGLMGIVFVGVLELMIIFGWVVSCWLTFIGSWFLLICCIFAPTTLEYAGEGDLEEMENVPDG